MLSKFYSLDECYEKDKVYDYLENLQNNEIILFEMIDTDLIKIKDIGLSEKDMKDLLSFFDEKYVIDYTDYDESDDEDSNLYDDEDDYYSNDDFY